MENDSISLDGSDENQSLIEEKSSRFDIDLEFSQPLMSRWTFFTRHKAISLSILGGLLFVLAAFVVFLSLHHEHSPPNIVIMIADGFGPSSETLNRVVNNQPSTLDSLLTGTIKTYSDTSWITDSAAAATAFACGVKTFNGAIGLDSYGEPCMSIIEAAKSKGYHTGLVVTSRVTHATPAGFTAHVDDRNNEDAIAEQQVMQNIDLVFGGGKTHFTPSGRADGKDLIAELRLMGYQVIYDQDDLLEESGIPLSTPIYGLFNEDHIDFEIDRTDDPSLSFLLQSALHLLEEPFFLVVEGSRIDHAAHLNDPAALYHEINGYNQAIDVVLDYTLTHPHTRFVSTSDHDTGGLSLGWQPDFDVYPIYEWDPEPLLRVTKSSAYMANLILNNAQDPQTVLHIHANVTATPEELSQIQKYVELYDIIRLATTLGRIESRHCLISWATTGHTGVDVNLYANNFPEMKGNMENTDVNKLIQNVIHVNLDEMTK